MNHYTYMLVDPISEMKYVGVRSCKCSIEEDPYKGSSSIMTKEEKSRCIKLILGTFPNREEAMRHEIELHSKLNVLKNLSYWNRAAATSTGHTVLGRVWTDKDKENLSNKLKGRVFTTNHIERLRKAQQTRVKEGRGADLVPFPKGEDHPSRIHTSVYEWQSVLGKKFVGTNLEFRDTLYPKSTIQAITRIVKGERVQHDGWYIVRNISSGCTTSECVPVEHVNWCKDEETFIGTATQLSSKTGLPVGALNKVVAGKRNSAYGWNILIGRVYPSY